jgi:hypothetical protein
MARCAWRRADDETISLRFDDGRVISSLKPRSGKVIPSSNNLVKTPATP